MNRLTHSHPKGIYADYCKINEENTEAEKIKIKK